MDNEVLFKLMSQGFVIYPENDKFVVAKHYVPGNQFTYEDIVCESHEEAVKKAIELLERSNVHEFLGIVRYNRGLGVEYKNLPNIFAECYEKAVDLASKLAEEILSDPSCIILEIKVKLKNWVFKDTYL